MSRDGRRALTAGRNGTAWLWNLTTGKRTTLPAKNKRDPLEFSLFSDNGRRFATFYESGAFCVWDEGQLAARKCLPGIGADRRGLQQRRPPRPPGGRARRRNRLGRGGRRSEGDRQAARRRNRELGAVLPRAANTS